MLGVHTFMRQEGSPDSPEICYLHSEQQKLLQAGPLQRLVLSSAQRLGSAAAELGQKQEGARVRIRLRLWKEDSGVLPVVSRPVSDPQDSFPTEVLAESHSCAGIKMSSQIINLTSFGPTRSVPPATPAGVRQVFDWRGCIGSEGLYKTGLQRDLSDTDGSTCCRTIRTRTFILLRVRR